MIKLKWNFLRLNLMKIFKTIDDILCVSNKFGYQDFLYINIIFIYE